MSWRLQSQNTKRYRGPLLVELHKRTQALPGQSSGAARSAAKAVGDEARLLAAVEVPGLLEGRPKLITGEAG